MSIDPKILITYVKTGGGHLSLSKTIASYLWQHYPHNTQIRISDFFLESGSTHTDTFLKKSFNDLVKYPRRNIFFHDRILKKYKMITRIWIYVRFRSSFKHVYEFLAKEQPDIVLSTHSFTAYVLAKVKKKYNLNFTLISLNPDPYGSSAFVEINKDVDYVIVSSNGSRDSLLEEGFLSQKVIQKPFPLNRDFEISAKPAPELVYEMGLDVEKKTLLISFGGAGVGNIISVMKKLIAMGNELNVIVVTGWNTVLHKALKEAFPGNQTQCLNHVFLGFADNMHELITLCDFAFIKPGPSSMYECLLKKKPMIFYQYTHHLEKANVEFAVDAGVGFYAGKDKHKFFHYVEYLLDEHNLQHIKDTYDKIQVTNGTAEIAEFVYHVCDEDILEKEVVTT